MNLNELYIISFEKVNMKLSSFSDHENKNLPTDEMDLFLHWSEKYQFWYNIWYLQRLLRQCCAIDLLDKCKEFASEKLHTAKIFYFTRSLNGNFYLLLALSRSVVKYVIVKQMQTCQANYASLDNCQRE